MFISKNLRLSLVLVCCCALLGGCGALGVEVPAQTEAPESLPYEEPETPAEEQPAVNMTVGGVTYTGQETDIDLREADGETAEQLLALLPQMTQLRSIELGEGGEAAYSRIPWEDIAAMEAACPGAEIHYSFTLYGKPFDLQSTEMDLNHITMDDEGALVKKVALCMPKLNYLDMDFCEVSDEAMADIRDALPNAEVVWRIWFGNGRHGGYSVRTNVTKILASNPDKAGELNPENTVALKYCTKVRYLDLGHNDQLSDLSFCTCMPDLEVAIFAMGAFSDLSPLANCEKLEYLEIQTAAVHDLSPLSGLKNLRHLNICYNFTLMDITPLYELTDLERLYIGSYDPISPDQIAEMQRRAPNCLINVTATDPTGEGWRYLGTDAYGFTIVNPRYELLRQQFEYDTAPYCYAYIENDPLYFPHE